MPKHKPSPRDLVALRLAGTGELDSRALGAALVLTLGGARKMIDRLVASRLIERYGKQKATDGAQGGGRPLHMYRLTEKGRDAL
jgi:predicted ArsR family transcriptional regulator